MRALLVAFLLLAPLAPLASAQDAGKPLLTDAKGDARADAGPDGSQASHPVSGELADRVDVVSLALRESDETLAFILGVANVKGRTYAEHVVSFTWRDVDHAVVYTAFTSFGDPEGSVNAWACLVTRDGVDEDYVWCDMAATDEGAHTFAFEVPKHVILDGRDRMPLKGDALTGLRVDASSPVFGGGFPVEVAVMDAMPDDAATGASFTFAKGDHATGNLILGAPDRLRVSNGGATTFVFQVLVRNLGEAEDEFDLTVLDLPHGWNATVQSPVAVPGKDEKTVTVLASVPFAHDHGGFSSFNVSGKSRSDPASEARVRLGVLHTPIPQPAGHHPDLFLHGEAYDFGVFSTVFPYVFTYMNTVPDHATDPAEVPGWDNGRGTTWWIPLNPGLRMGLDFDLERVGALEGMLAGKRAGEAALTARLHLYDGDDSMDDDPVLAESEPVKLTLDLQNPTPFALTLAPTEESDYVAYRPDQTMYLVMDLVMDGLPTPTFGLARAASPTLLTEGWKLNLPLNEYHDKLSGDADGLSTLRLVAEGPVEKLGRPASTLTYAFKLTADAAGTYDVDIAGADAGAAEIAPSGPLTLDAGESRVLTLAVRVPAQAAAGEQLEVLLFAHDESDPSRMAIARTKTTVSLGADAAQDESAVFAAAREAENDAPAPGVALLLAACGLVALLARRR